LKTFVNFFINIKQRENITINAQVKKVNFILALTSRYKKNKQQKHYSLTKNNNLSHTVSLINKHQSQQLRQRHYYSNRE